MKKIVDAIDVSRGGLFHGLIGRLEAARPKIMDGVGGITAIVVLK